MYTFKTPVDISLSHVIDDTNYTYAEDVKIRWSLKLETSDIGIHHMSVVVPDQVIDVKYHIATDDNDICLTTQLNLKDVIVIAYILDEMEILQKTHLIPKELYFHKNKWHLEFNLDDTP